MKILIIDNEAELRTGLRNMVEKYCSPFPQIEEADGVRSGLEQIASFAPDIVFLDIEMGDGTGFDLLRQLDAPRFQLIFTTAHNQYAIQAIKFSALDYLLKPIDVAELKISLEKAIANINKPDLARQLAVMMQQLAGKPATERKIVLNDKQTTYFINMSDIVFCEAQGPYTRFHISGREPILISKTLREYEDLLTPHGFIRTHHSYITNPAKIKMYDKTDGGALILEGGHSIPISQRKKDNVLQVLNNQQ